MSGWQPIRTAPHDGTDIEIKHSSWDCGPQPGYFDVDSEWWRIEGPDGWIGVGIFPSHWRPLQSPVQS